MYIRKQLSLSQAFIKYLVLHCGNLFARRSKFHRLSLLQLIADLICTLIYIIASDMNTTGILYHISILLF